MDELHFGYIIDERHTQKEVICMSQKSFVKSITVPIGMLETAVVQMQSMSSATQEIRLRKAKKRIVKRLNHKTFKSH